MKKTLHMMCLVLVAAACPRPASGQTPLEAPAAFWGRFKSMKTKLALAVIAALAASLFSTRADILRADKRIVVTGMIFQDAFGTEPARKMPLTIRNVFEVYGRLEDPKDYRYYRDVTTNAYIIGLKGTADGGDGASVVNILRFPPDGGVDWTPKPGKSFVGGGPCVLLEGFADHLDGTYLDFGSIGANSETIHWKFYGFGLILGRKTLISGSILNVAR